jgi:hypothetical protein
MRLSRIGNVFLYDVKVRSFDSESVTICLELIARITGSIFLYKKNGSISLKIVFGKNSSRTTNRLLLNVQGQFQK